MPAVPSTPTRAPYYMSLVPMVPAGPNSLAGQPIAATSLPVPMTGVVGPAGPGAGGQGGSGAQGLGADVAASAAASVAVSNRPEAVDARQQLRALDAELRARGNERSSAGLEVEQAREAVFAAQATLEATQHAADPSARAALQTAAQEVLQEARRRLAEAEPRLAAAAEAEKQVRQAYRELEASVPKLLPHRPEPGPAPHSEVPTRPAGRLRHGRFDRLRLFERQLKSAEQHLERTQAAYDAALSELQKAEAGKDGFDAKALVDKLNQATRELSMARRGLEGSQTIVQQMTARLAGLPSTDYTALPEVRSPEPVTGHWVPEDVGWISLAATEGKAVVQDMQQRAVHAQEAYAHAQGVVDERQKAVQTAEAGLEEARSSLEKALQDLDNAKWHKNLARRHAAHKAALLQIRDAQQRLYEAQARLQSAQADLRRAEIEAAPLEQALRQAQDALQKATQGAAAGESLQEFDAERRLAQQGVRDAEQAVAVAEQAVEQAGQHRDRGNRYRALARAHAQLVGARDRLAQAREHAAAVQTAFDRGDARAKPAIEAGLLTLGTWRAQDPALPEARRPEFLPPDWHPAFKQTDAVTAAARVEALEQSAAGAQATVDALEGAQQGAAQAVREAQAELEAAQQAVQGANIPEDGPHKSEGERETAATLVIPLLDTARRHLAEARAQLEVVFAALTQARQAAAFHRSALQEARAALAAALSPGDASSGQGVPDATGAEGASTGALPGSPLPQPPGSGATQPGLEVDTGWDGDALLQPEAVLGQLQASGAQVAQAYERAQARVAERLQAVDTAAKAVDKARSDLREARDAFHEAMGKGGTALTAQQQAALEKIGDAQQQFHAAQDTLAAARKQLHEAQAEIAPLEQALMRGQDVHLRAQWGAAASRSLKALASERDQAFELVRQAQRAFRAAQQAVAQAAKLTRRGDRYRALAEAQSQLDGARQRFGQAREYARATHAAFEEGKQRAQPLMNAGLLGVETWLSQQGVEPTAGALADPLREFLSGPTQVAMQKAEARLQAVEMSAAHALALTLALEDEHEAASRAAGDARAEVDAAQQIAGVVDGIKDDAGRHRALPAALRQLEAARQRLTQAQEHLEAVGANLEPMRQLTAERLDQVQEAKVALAALMQRLRGQASAAALSDPRVPSESFGVAPASVLLASNADGWGAGISDAELLRGWLAGQDMTT